MESACVAQSYENTHNGKTQWNYQKRLPDPLESQLPFHALRRLTKKAVNNYNNCPHGSLNMLSHLLNLKLQLPNVPHCQRTQLKVFTFKKSKHTDNPNQLDLFRK